MPEAKPEAKSEAKPEANANADNGQQFAIQRISFNGFILPICLLSHPVLLRCSKVSGNQN